MLTCHDASAIMSANNLVQIHIKLMKRVQNYRVYFDIWLLLKCCIAQGAMLLVLDTIRAQALMTTIYLCIQWNIQLLTSVMTHLITGLSVYSYSIHKNFEVSGVKYSSKVLIINVELRNQIFKN